MKTETIVYCVVALLLGMLLANMLKNVCGCKVVEGLCTSLSSTDNNNSGYVCERRDTDNNCIGAAPLSDATDATASTMKCHEFCKSAYGLIGSCRSMGDCKCSAL